MFKHTTRGNILSILMLGLLTACDAMADGSNLSNSDFECKVKQGTALREQGEFQKAIAAFLDAQGLAKAHDDVRAQLECFMSLGILYWDIGKVKDSDETFRRALLLSQKLGLRDIEMKCNAYIKIYEAYVRGKDTCAAGLHHDSIAQFNIAIDLAKKINSPEHELKCLRQMSMNYHQLEAFFTFLTLNQTGLDLAKKLNHKKEEGRCLNNIGIYFFETCSYSQALAHLEEALSIIRATYENQVDLSACLNNIGLVFRELGEFEKAIPFFEEALMIDRGLMDEESVAIELNNLGSTYHRKGRALTNDKDLAISLDFYLKSLRIVQEGKNRKLLINILNNIAIVYGSLGRYLLSLDYFRSALQEAVLIEHDYELCNIQSNIGYVQCKLGNYLEAKRFFSRAAHLASKVERKDVLWEAYLGLGQCSEITREDETALVSFRSAISVIEIMRGRIALDDHKVGFVRDKLKAYEALLNLLFNLKEKEQTSSYDREIFEVIEKAKARAFLDELGRVDQSTSDSTNQEYKNEQVALSKKISVTISELMRSDLGETQRRNLESRLDLEEEKYSSLLNRLRTEEAEYPQAALPQETDPHKIQDQYLDERSAIIEYYLGEKRSFGIFLSKNSFILKALPSRAEIEDSLRAFLKMLSTPPQRSFQGIPAGRRIYNDLLHPFEEGLSRPIDHLFVIPDGILHYLPFETLVQDDGKSTEPRFLIELFDISYGPSVSSLEFLMKKKQHRQHGKVFLAVGNPVYLARSSKTVKRRDQHKDVLREIYMNDGFELSPLPYSEREVRSVSRYFPSDKVDVLLESRANEEAIKSSPLDEYQIIHFACHGFLDEKTPLRSALVLTLDDDLEEDGFLQAREICNLRLNADLVVLSACQTGKGRLENAEGVLGLPRAFFYAGARSTISSLWKINDKSTSEIMPDFYRYLAAGNNKARSLRLAKLNMLKTRFSHPFYWAAFVLHGDPLSAIYKEGLAILE